MAYEFYVTIDGTKTGRFHGESRRESHRDKITGLEFLYEVTSPRDVATGQASGKRQHKPITITKEWGAASPQIFQALVNNEALKSVLFEFVQPTPEGAEAVAYTIRLTNASISQFRQYIGDVDNAAYDSTSDSLELERVSFTFQKIEIQHLASQTTAVDDPLK
jgi:type VI secretion system secreted protein Hcp